MNSRAYRQLHVDVLGLLTIAAYGSWFYAFGVLLPDLSEMSGVGEAILGGAYGLANLLSGFLAMMFGRILDSRSVRPVFIVLGPLGTLIYAATALVPSGWPFVATFVVGGGLIGGAGFYPMTQTIVLRFPDNNPIADITRLTIWGAFSSPIMVPLTEYIRKNMGLDAALIVPAMLVCAAFVGVSFVIPNNLRAKNSIPSAGIRIATAVALRNPRVVWLWISASLMSITVAVLLVFQIPMMQFGGLTSAAAAGVAGARGLMQLAGRLPLVALVRVFGTRRLLMISRILVVISCVFVMFGRSLPMALVYGALGGFSIGALSALDGMVSREILPAGDLGSLSGALSLSNGVFAAIGLAAVGWVNDESGTPMIGFFGIVVVGLLAVACTLPLLGIHSEASATSTGK